YWTQLGHEGDIKAGDLVTNPDHAKALRLIAKHGADAFYKGEIAEAIVSLMQEHGGPITKQDMAGYKPRVMKPIVGEFRGHAVYSMPPPSSGGIAMQQMFGLLERRLDEIGELSRDNPLYTHLLTETMKHAFADRAEWLADSAFVDVPVERLLSDEYLDELAARISMSHTGKKFDYGSTAPPPNDGGTSHFSVIDSNGMAVACTETINLTFGSKVIVPGFGFALNNEMDDFTTIPGQPNAFGLQQSDRNLPQPGKRPLSSMSPTIIVKEGKVILICGAAGGPRIITSTAQCLLNCMLFDMNAGEASRAPRIHHQWMPEVLNIEARWSNQAVLSAMEAQGHVVMQSGHVGVANLIQVTSDGIHAASDPRRGGTPSGY
ncbi:MAG: gamma-glutamyltransferase family protein, partial [Planctomycetota bacterium]|nr:gamma-glutamyltransferase family protein [Planctomycetota bacterium]